MFSLGKLYMTAGVAEWCASTGLNLSPALSRHAHCDWGELDSYDKQANDDALKSGGRLFSSYTVACRKIWIITEADRSSTTVLFPDEY